ncbi:MAG: hypothetical protein K6E18_02595 [Lachnospiraceae bacterium]|nr:hypothetical protein [Lachnospiraceae bacterium]
MLFFIVTFLISLLVWLVFAYFFRKDRSRYRNSYLLFFALLTDIPLIREYIAVHAEKKHGVMFALGWIVWMTTAYIFMKKGILFI